MELYRDEILKKNKNLKSSKATRESDIPPKTVKENIDFLLISSFNEYVPEGSFPSCLEKVDVIPIFRKCARNSKDIYIPVSIISNIPKLSEKALFKQMPSFFDKMSSVYLCGFRKGFSA